MLLIDDTGALTLTTTYQAHKPGLNLFDQFNVPFSTVQVVVYQALKGRQRRLFGAMDPVPIESCWGSSDNVNIETDNQNLLFPAVGSSFDRVSSIVLFLPMQWANYWHQ